VRARLRQLLSEDNDKEHAMDDVIEIGQLVVRERQSRVMHLSDQLRNCFHPDATVNTSWVTGSAAAFVSGRPAPSAAGAGPIINRAGAPVVHHSGRRAVVELPSTTTRWIPVNGVEAELVSFMRLLYRVEQRGGEWKISDLSTINEGDTLNSAVPGTELRVVAAALAGLRHSYRFLMYTRALDGETVSSELPGIDRPEGVKALYDDAFAWLAEHPAAEGTQA
jgi:hypothetical protein